MLTLRKSLVAALVAGAVFAPSALAQGGPGGGGGGAGGGGGGGTPIPTSFPAADCTTPNPLGNVVWTTVPGGQCLSFTVDANRNVTLLGVTPGPGYTFDVKKDAVNDIEVNFSNGNPAQDHQYRLSGTSVRVS